MNKKLITAKEIVDRHGISFQTVNHYTNFGLFTVITKHGNVRMYDEVEIRERLAKISELVAEGYSLRLIRKTLIGI